MAARIQMFTMPDNGRRSYDEPMGNQMTGKRPSVFIGSSSEGREIAEALQANMDSKWEAVVWSQGVVGLSGGTLETLVEKAELFDFAILALTPDDLIESRGA